MLHEPVRFSTSSRNSFTQYYGSRQLDAGLLMMPLVGFLSPHDPRIVGTVQAIEHELLQDGLVMRLGNFPLALSHFSLENTAYTLLSPSGPAQHRQQTDQATSETGNREN